MKTNKYILVIALAFFCTVGNLFAVDKSYYNSLDGKSGKELFDAIHAVSKTGYKGLSYDALWSAYCAIDINSSGYVWDMYSNSTTYTCGGSAQGANNGGSEGNSYNREHSIPKSWFGGTTNSGTPGTDLFHVVPVDGYVNTMRSANAYGEVATTSYISNTGCKLGTPKSISVSYSILNTSGSSTQSCSKKNVFEPMDEYKGDFARGYFGTLIKWANGDYQTFTTNEGAEIFNTSYDVAHYYGLTSYGVALLLKWHREDPVSQKEIDRNNGIQNKQGNRNPFIDYPCLVEYLWGNKTGETVTLSDLIGTFSGTWTTGDGCPCGNEPAITLPSADIFVGSASANSSVAKTITIQGVNLTGNLSFAVSGTNSSLFALSTNSMTQANATAGSSLTITYRPTSSGNHTATLTISGGGLASSKTYTLTGTCCTPYNVTLSRNGITETIGACGTYTLPTTEEEADACDGWDFKGWLASGTSFTEGTTTAPTFVTYVSNATTLHAVYGQGSGSGGLSSAAYTFTTSGWNATLNGSNANWTSGKAGAGYSNSGVQVTAGASGANATCPTSYSSISSIVVSYCTNSSKGAGTIELDVNGTKVSNSVSTSGGTTARDLTFDFSSTKPSGTPKITVTCTTNSIYICGVTINYGGGGSTTVYKKQPCTTYNITLSGNGNTTGGTFETSATTAIVGTTIMLDADPNAGYTFGSWTVTKAGGGLVTVTNNQFTMPDADVTVSATFTENPKYTIRFYNNGSVISMQSVYENSEPDVPSDPEACEGYEFVGWYTSTLAANNTSEEDWITDFTVTGAQDYYAVYSHIETSGEGGSSTTDDVLTRETTGVTNTSYSEWSNKTGTSGAVYAGNSAGGNDAIQLRSNNSNSGIITTTSGGKVTKVAVTWQSGTASGRTIYIYGKNTAYSAASDLYGNNAGTQIGSIVCGTSTELTISSDYAYIGIRSSSGALYLTNVTITWSTSGGSSSTTYYTSLPDCNTPQDVTVTFNANGGTGTMANQTVPYNTATALTANTFTRTGYTFRGWATSTEGEKVYNDGADVTLTENTTLYAVWTVNNYTITTNAGTGGTLSASPSGSASYGATVIITATPDETHTLGSITVKDAANNDVPVSGTGDERTFTMPASNVTVSATFTEKQQYTINFIVDGETISTQNLYDGATAQQPTNPEACEGYTFVGWWTAAIAEETTTSQTWVTDFTVSGAQNYYAIFSRTETNGSGGSTTDSKTFKFSEIASANNWVNGTAYTPVTISPVSIAGNGEGNNAKYYTSDVSWRMYSGGSVSISVDGGSVTSVTSTPSQTFTISNGTALLSCSATIKFTQIVVNYTIAGGSTSTTYYTSSPVCVVPCSITPTMSFTNTTVELTTDDATYTQAVTISNKGAGQTVTYSSSDETVATVNASGVVTLLGKIGSTTITASVAEDGDYCEASASYTLTVTKAPCLLTGISLNTEDVSLIYTTGDVFSADDLIVTADYSNCVSSTVTPTSISSPDMSTAGTKTITVTYTENGITQTATFDIEVSAPVTYTVTWNVDGVESSVVYVEDDYLVLPSTPADCEGANGKKFVGWTASSSVDGSAPADLFTTASGIVTADKTYYAVFATATTTGSGSGNYELVEAAPTNWAGDYLIAYSNEVFADGRTGGTTGIGKQNSSVTPGDNLSGKEVAASWGDTYKVTIEESATSGKYLLKTQDGKYNYQSSNANGVAATDNKSTAEEHPLDITFNSSSDIAITVSSTAFHYNTQGYFRFYKDAGQNVVYLYKKTAGGAITYSNYSLVCDEPCALTSITLNTSGVTTSFTTGDTFTSAGLVVTANYSNCASATVTPASISSPDMTSVGTKTITVSYTENGTTKTATYSITVNAPVSYTITLDNNGSVTGGTFTASPASATAGTTVTLSATPVIGYRFVSWSVIQGSTPLAVSDNQFAMPAGDVTVSATFEAIPQYTIRFFDNGSQIGSDQTVYEGSLPVVPTNPEACEGYAFVGWWTEAIAEETTIAQTWVTDFTVSGAQDYYAVYSYSETGNGGGTTNGTKTFTFASIASVNSWSNGTAYTTVSDAPVTIEAQGGGNNGKWYTTDNGSWRMYSGGTVSISVSYGSVTSVTSSPNCSFTITDGVATFSPSARTDFTEINVEYTITGGSSSTTYYTSSPECVTPCTKLETPAVAAVAGNEQITLTWADVEGADHYTVTIGTGVGFTTECGNEASVGNIAHSGTTNTCIITGLTNGLTYTTSVVANAASETCDSDADEDTTTPVDALPTEVTVTFDANGGTGTMDAQVFPYDEEAALHANTFTRTGYTFTGWNTQASGSGSSYGDQAALTLTQNIILYAQWSKNSYTVTFTPIIAGQATVTVNGNSNGSLTAEYESTVSVAVAPETEYKVNTVSVSGGLTVTNAGNNTFTFTMPANDVTVTVTMVAKPTYIVRFFDNGDKVSELTVMEGEAVTPPAEPNGCTGYPFVGWWTAELAADNTESHTWINDFTATKDQDYYAVYSHTETNGGVATTSNESVTFSDLYSTNTTLNQTTIAIGTHASVIFDKGSNSNAPQYYTTGSAIRIYGGGTCVVSTDAGNITAITLTFSSGEGTNNITANVGTYNAGSWYGEASSVTFSIEGSSGHRRIAGIAVTISNGGSTTYYTTAPSCPTIDMVMLTDFSGAYLAVMPTLVNNGAEAVPMIKKDETYYHTSAISTVDDITWQLVERTTGCYIRDAAGNYLTVDGTSVLLGSEPYLWHANEDGRFVTADNTGLCYSATKKAFVIGSDDAYATDETISGCVTKATNVILDIALAETRNDSKVKNGYYATLCLPFDVPAPMLTGARAFNVVGKQVNDEGLIAGIVMEEKIGILTAGKPYVIQYTDVRMDAWYAPGEEMVDKTQTAVGLVGNLAVTPMSVPAGCYGLSNNLLRKVAEGANATIGQYKAYFNLSEVPEMSEPSEMSAYRVMYTTDMATDMEQTSGNTGINWNEPVYNILGIRVGKDATGVLIQNGTKFIIRF